MGATSARSLPNEAEHRWEWDDSALNSGEWLEIGEDYTFEILPPFSIKAGIFAMREFPTGLVTSILFSLSVDGCIRHFRGYCDLADKSSAERMRSAVIERESGASRAMTHDEKLEHIWLSTADWAPLAKRDHEPIVTSAVVTTGQATAWTLDRHGLAQVLRGFLSASASEVCLWPFRPSVSWRLNRRPFGSRPLSRRGAAGHAALDKAGTRASQGLVTPA